MAKNLVWIASYPKSGNTWVRSIIYAALVGRIELNKFADVVPAFNALEIASPENPRAHILEEHVQHWDSAQRMASDAAGRNFQFFKTHNAAAEINGTQFPHKDHTARAVYIVRDPRDVAVSYARHYSADINDTVITMLNERNYTFDDWQAEFLSSWKNHILSWNGKDFPVLFLRYEDLLSNTRQQVERILKFLRIHPKLGLTELIQATSFDSLRTRESKGGFSEAVNDQAFFWQGKSGLGKSFIGADFKRMDEEFADVMSHFRYRD